MYDKTPIFRSLAMIEERIQEKLTVEILAEGVHFSKYHYQRMFREAVGDSVMGYVTRRKLALAAGELAGTDSTVLEIALKYGYESHEGFTRSFKANLGVTPAEYRKYHLSVGVRTMGKEKNAMMYSKATDEIIRELNGLIVEARETAADTRLYQKSRGAELGAAFYGEFWELTAGRAEEMAQRLAQVLERVTGILQSPDEISARFLMLKAIEDAAFVSSITAFQTGLMIARAKEEHREAYQPLCGRYDQLAGRARMGAGKIADFFQELAAMIFQDMRQNAELLLQAAAKAGETAAESLADSALPYGYIKDEIMDMANRLSDMPLEEVTAKLLEDFQFRLENIAYAAQMDTLRMPSHGALFEGIGKFRNCLEDATAFFQGLSGEAFGKPEAGEGDSADRYGLEKMCDDLAMQEGILLFWLKGEIQKLESYLEEGQKARLETVCEKLGRVVNMADAAADSAAAEEVFRLLGEAYGELSAEAGQLGAYGSALRFIAEQVKGPLGHQTSFTMP